MTQPNSLSQIIADPSCMDDYDPNSMNVDKAREFIKQFLNPVSQIETLSLFESLGRILAADILSPANVPNYDNSAMDGYAFNAADIQDGVTTELTIAGTAFAGNAYSGTMPRGACVRIMTGAMLPPGTDTVIMQEKTTVKNNTLSFTETIKPGSNVRYAGEDLKQGQVVLAAGHLIEAADLGLIASLGIGSINVYRKLKVAFFSTGDELVSIGKPLQTGQVYDSNR